MLSASIAATRSSAEDRSGIVRQHIAYPTIYTLSNGHQVDGEEGFILVPENRHRRGSRQIVVHYYRIRGSIPGPPIFHLPGGPGDLVLADAMNARDGKASRLERFPELLSGRDVVIVNQRGAAGAPGSPPMIARYPNPDPEGEHDQASDRANYRARLQETLSYWRSRGVDVSGYDILNHVEDINDLRRTLGYGRIILDGTSFGSQTSLYFLRLHPELVDRLLLAGIEPLDYAYDSPATVWAALGRIAASAEADPLVKSRLPPSGLLAAIREIVDRLRRKPVHIRIRTPDGRTAGVWITAEDFQQALLPGDCCAGRDPGPDQTYLRRAVERWPQYITELYAGDYRLLGFLTYRRRSESADPLIFHLIDHSMGVSERRDASLRREAAIVPTGDVNALYRWVQDIVPTRPVPDALRDEGRIEAPVLLLSGTADVSTPLENAIYLRAHVARGRLMVLDGVSHNGLQEGCYLNPVIEAAVQRFVVVPTPSDAAAVLRTLPERPAMPALHFRFGARPLYELWVAPMTDAATSSAAKS